MTRGRRRILVAAAVLVALVALGALATRWVGQTLGPRLTRERIEAALAEALDRPVRVEGVALRPWLGRLEVEGIAIPPEAAIGRAEVSVGISSLWRRELVLSRILLEDVRLDLVAGAGTEAPAAVPAIPDRITLGPVTAAIRLVQVERAHIDYRDPAAGRAVTVEGLSLGAAPSAGGGLDLTAGAARVRVVAAGLDETVESLDGDARLEASHLVVRRLTARWQGASLAVEGEAALGAALALTLRLAGDVPLEPLGARFGAPWPLQGRARIEARVTGSPPAVAAAGDVTIPALEAGALAARRVRGRVAWADGQLRVDDLRADALQGAVQGSVRARPAALADTEIELRLEQVALGEVQRLLGRDLGLEGRVTGAARLRGDPRRLHETGEGALRVETAQVAATGTLAPLGTAAISGQARLDRGVLDIAEAEARWPALRLAVRGPVAAGGPRDLRVEAAGDLRALAALWRWPHLAGHGAITVTGLRGSWRAPSAQGVARAPALEVMGFRLQDVQVPFRLQGLALALDGAEGRLGQSRLTLSGELRWPEDRALDAATLREHLRLALDVAARARVEDLAPWLPEGWPGSGAFAVRARLSGVPAAWRGDGEVEAGAVTLRYPVEALRARFTADGAGVGVPQAEARVLGVPVTAEGGWRWDGSGRLRAELGPARLAALPAPAALALAGLGRGQLTVARSAGQLTATATVRGEDITVIGLALGRGEGRLTLSDDRLEAALAFPGARITAEASGRLAAGQALTVRAQADGQEVGPLVRHLVGDGEAPVTGTATARAELTVPLDDPAAARGAVIVHPVRLLAAGRTWGNREPVLIRRTPGTLRVDRLQLEADGVSLSAGGAVHDDGRLDLRVNGHLPLAALAALRPELREARGLLDVRATVAGSRTEPEVTGEATLTGGFLALRDYPDAVRDLRARLVATPGAVRLVEARGTMGGGELTATGDAVLEGAGLGGYRVMVQARRVALPPLGSFETAWDADLELVGFGGRAQLRGDARLLRGTYTRDISLLRLLLERRPATGAPAEAALNLDLRVHLDDNVLLRTRLARLRAGGTLTVQGTTAAPVVFGTAEVREGEIIFRNRTFTITSASARFTDPRRIDPILDVRAEARIREHDVTLHMLGRSDDLEIRFASSPPLPEEDVLSLVAFGTTRDQVGAGALVGEVAGFLVQDLLGVQPGRAGMDVLEVTTQETGGRNLRVGKQLTPQLLLVYSQGLEHPDEQRLRVEYQVFGPLLVAGEQDFRGGFGADVMIRLRFR